MRSFKYKNNTIERNKVIKQTVTKLMNTDETSNYDDFILDNSKIESDKNNLAVVENENRTWFKNKLFNFINTTICLFAKIAQNLRNTLIVSLNKSEKNYALQTFLSSAYTQTCRFPAVFVLFISACTGIDRQKKHSKPQVIPKDPHMRRFPCDPLRTRNL